MKIFTLFILMFSTFLLFADEFDSNLNYIKNDILVGEGNFKAGFNLSYGYYKNNRFEDSESKSTSFQFGSTNNFIPYQPMSSGIFAIYGINDSLQLFASFKAFDYTQGKNKSSSYYNEYTHIIKGGSPFIGVTYGIYIEDILLSISPYISVPFYEKYKYEDNKDHSYNTDNSFEQKFNYGFLLNFNFVKDSYLINGLINYTHEEGDYFNIDSYIFGFDFGFVLNSFEDKVKIGILQINYKSSSNEYQLSDSEYVYYKVTLTYNFNINSNNAINLQAYYYLPTEDAENTTDYGIAFQFEFK